jgi:hypothetical protein
MTDLVNPIWPGFAWSQEFELDAAIAPAGTTLRITLTQEGQTRLPAINANLTRPDATRHVLSLTALQTSGLRAPGNLWGDFVLRGFNGSEAPINLRLSLPVEKPLTVPLP